MHRYIITAGVYWLAPLRGGCHYKLVIFETIPWIATLRFFCGISFLWMRLMIGNTDSCDGLVPSGTNHLLNQCWPSSMTTYGFPNPQWCNWLFSMGVQNSYDDIYSLEFHLRFQRLDIQRRTNRSHLNARVCYICIHPHPTPSPTQKRLSHQSVKNRNPR